MFLSFDISSFFLGALSIGILIVMILLVATIIINLTDMEWNVKRFCYDDVKVNSLEEIQEHYKEQYCLIMVAEKISTNRKKKKLIKAIKKRYQEDVDYFQRPKKVEEMLKKINGK